MTGGPWRDQNGGRFTLPQLIRPQVAARSAAACANRSLRATCRRVIVDASVNATALARVIKVLERR